MFKLAFIVICSVLILQTSSQQFCEKYYFSYPLTASWANAVDLCRSIGEHWDLVSIQNVLKANELDIFLNAHNAANLTNLNVWTSGHRRINQVFEQFLWIDQLVTLQFARWEENEPQNDVVDANIVLRYNETGAWRWATIRNGATAAYYICERNSCAS